MVLFFFFFSCFFFFNDTATSEIYTLSLHDALPIYGVVNNVKVGDKAFGWNGDHIEPGVSIDSENVNEHFALHYLVCTGNKAIEIGRAHV